ncbi:hypothetical protein [Inquilinus ginsengisoli]|uniref:hypothetical protein n=1 Tax=Inquilinus ginsengisoli TaxID=363840 RepID=UPI003D1E48F6
MWLDDHRANAKDGFLVRSSGVDETLADRGRYLSIRIQSEATGVDAGAAARKIFEHASVRGLSGKIGIVIQIFRNPDGAGHFSNEIRVSPTRNQWQYEIDVPSWLPPRGLNSRFAPRPDPKLPLYASIFVLHANLRSVGRWLTEVITTRVHVEWLVCEKALYLVQVDFEWNEIDSGVDPNDIDISGKYSVPDILSTEIFERYILGSETEWKKLKNLMEFDFESPSACPILYFANGAHIAAALSADQTQLRDEIERLTNGRAVVRMDVLPDKGIMSFNLPRTETVNGQAAIDWIANHVAEFKERGLEPTSFAFILHAFIPARVGAWAYADPGEPIAFVDALWGLPDGLQVLPHDSYQVDIRREKILSERIRFKPRFLCERGDGSWEYVDILRRRSRSSVLSEKDALEIGIRTANIANKLGRRAQIMWFSGVPEALAIGRNVPWFRAREIFDPAPRQAPKYRPFRIKSYSDLESIGDEHVTLKLDPDAELIREEEFLDKVIQVAQQKRLPVEIQGSALSHTYYKLYQAGVAVDPPNTAKYNRVRGRQVFGKLVRDRIPDRIRASGERVIEAKLAKEDIVAALIGKLFEEGFEFSSASSPKAKTEELSDILEVVMSLAANSDVEWNDVLMMAEEKRSSRGSFRERRVLLETALPSPGASSIGVREVRLRDLRDGGGGEDDTVQFTMDSIINRKASSTLIVGDIEVLICVTLNRNGIEVKIDGAVPHYEGPIQLDLFT